MDAEILLQVCFGENLGTAWSTLIGGAGTSNLLGVLYSQFLGQPLDLGDCLEYPP